MLEHLDEDVSFIRVLAVASLTAEARNRALRRPLIRNEKELKQISRDRTKLWPPISIKRLKREHTLLKGQIAIYEQQQECDRAAFTYLKEAVLFGETFSDLDTE